jgi:hypothetical protein
VKNENSYVIVAFSEEWKEARSGKVYRIALAFAFTVPFYIVILVSLPVTAAARSEP